MILTGETEVLGEKHYTAWVVGGWMSMEIWSQQKLTPQKK
jgi:hypothetical protein